MYLVKNENRNTQKSISNVSSWVWQNSFQLFQSNFDKEKNHIYFEMYEIVQNSSQMSQTSNFPHVLDVWNSGWLFVTCLVLFSKPCSKWLVVFPLIHQSVAFRVKVVIYRISSMIVGCHGDGLMNHLSTLDPSKEWADLFGVPWLY